MNRVATIQRMERELRRISNDLGDYSNHGATRRLTTKVKIVLISLIEREIIRIRLTNMQKDSIMRTGILSKKYWDKYIESVNSLEGLDGDGI